MFIHMQNAQVIFEGKYPVTALDIHELSISQGEWVNILGPSGSGKTTLLNVVGGLEQLSSGTATVNRENIADLSSEALQTYRRTMIGYIYQDFRLFEQYTVLENVMLPQWPYEAKKTLKEKAEETLDQLQMSHRLHSLPGELSGGEKQRTAIARALIHEPKILLCDEPTGNVDEENRQNILRILTKLHDEGMTILLVTHDIEVAKWGTRKVFIRDGQIYEKVSR